MQPKALVVLLTIGLGIAVPPLFIPLFIIVAILYGVGRSDDEKRADFIRVLCDGGWIGHWHLMRDGPEPEGFHDPSGDAYVVYGRGEIIRPEHGRTWTRREAAEHAAELRFKGSEPGLNQSPVCSRHVSS
jgi:hypothetical protein